MNLDFKNELSNIKDAAESLGNNLSNTIDENKKNKNENENNILNLAYDIGEDFLKTREITNNFGVDKTVNDITKTLENNIEKEIEKLKLDNSMWEKISKSKVSEVVKVAIEAVLKGVLKKKFGINFSTFNEMKDVVNDVMDGNLKDAIKNSSDAAIDNIKVLDGTVKSTIKTIKNSVIDNTIDSKKYEILNKQTKILNRISKNCMEFNEALRINDADIIRKRANSIKNDMKKILPIRETITSAKCVLDKYSLWQNKGNKELTEDEIALVEKLNLSA